MTDTEAGKKEAYLTGASLEFGENQDVIISDDSQKWALSLNLDRTAEELIFKVDLVPQYWLAVGLSDNLHEADII